MTAIHIVPLDSLGNEVRDIRKSKGMSQQDLAKKAKMTAKTVSEIEHGGSFSFRQLKKLTDALGVYMHLAISFDKEDMKRLIDLKR